jgi:hypothetical protein
MKKKKTEKSRLDDVIKAMRRGNREGQQDVLGPGFHSTNRIHRSKKTYTRKLKHKATDQD